MKKICTMIIVLMFAMSSLCFAGISSSGGGKSSSSSSSRPSTPSISTSKPASSGLSSSSVSKPSTPTVGTSGGGISTTKTQQKEADLKQTQQLQQREAQAKLSDRNDYYRSQPYVGHSNFGTGLMAGLVAGSLLHPTTVVTPVGAGAGYVSAPIGFQIIFFIIDILLFALFCYVVYRLWKHFKK